MQSISAAIVLLAGAVIFSAGAHVSHGDTQAFVMVAGGVIGLFGLIGWMRASNDNQGER